MPENGVFDWGVVRRASDICDGLSNTLAVGEFVHRDQQGPCSVHPGNVRPWMLGANYSTGSYAFKVVQYSINAKIDRGVAGGTGSILFNYLPMGSHHPDGAHFLLADSSVRFLPETMDLETYRSLTTCDGDGAVIGTHRVRVACFANRSPDAPPPDPTKEPSVGKSLIPRKYLYFDTSGLRVEVESKNEPFVFELAD